VRAAIMDAPVRPLELRDMHDPWPGPGEVRIRVAACAICRTDLHVLDGDLAEPKLPLVLGHQIVGVVETVGDAVADRSVGDRVGVPWLGWACGELLSIGAREPVRSSRLHRISTGRRIR
jgi:alcohol dehydrogenase, propanol-preferring